MNTQAQPIPDERVLARLSALPPSYRWLLVLLVWVGVVGLFFAILRSPPVWTLDIGTPGDEHFIGGFSVPEETAGATFRWSLPESQFLLHGAGARSFTLDMRLHRPTATLGQPYALTLTGQEHTAASFALSDQPGWRVYRVLIPPDMVTDTAMQAVPLALTGTTYTPGPGDHRDLGVPIDQLTITPLSGGSVATGPLLVRSLLLTWWLAVLAGGLWWLRVSLLARLGRLFGALLVVLPTAAAAVVLLVWAARSPYTLAWALPSMPWLPGLATAVLLLMLWPRQSAAEQQSVPDLLTGRAAAVGLGAVLLLALGMRFYQLADLPYGLWRDEAEHGLIALRIWNNPDYRPVYVAEGRVNMPAFGFYPFALAVGTWGVHVWTLRIATALAGALTVLPLYALVQRMYGRRDVALLAAALLAVSSWHLTMSRFSFPTIFEPLLGLSGLWLLLLGLDMDSNDTAHTGGWHWPAATRYGLLLLAGLLLGTAAQMYHTGRVVPVVAVWLAGLLLWHRRHLWRRWLTGVAVLACGLALALGPLVLYALNNPDDFNDRVGDVAILSEKNLEGRSPVAVFDESLGRHALMFNVRGDGNSRHHAPERPLLDVVSGLGFLAGCVVLLRHWRDWRSQFVLGALVLGVAPSLLAVNGPHAMRSIGAVAFACIIAAVGWRALIGWMGRWLPARGAQQASMAAVVALALVLNFWTYFVYMPLETRVWTSFYPIHTKVGTYLREMAQEEGAEALRHVYVPEGLTDNSVFQYLAYGLPVQTFDDDSLSMPADSDALFVFSIYTYEDEVQELHSYLNPQAEPVVRGPNLPGEPVPAFVVHRAEE